MATSLLCEAFDTAAAPSEEAGVVSLSFDGAELLPSTAGAEVGGGWLGKSLVVLVVELDWGLGNGLEMFGLTMTAEDDFIIDRRSGNASEGSSAEAERVRERDNEPGGAGAGRVGVRTWSSPGAPSPSAPSWILRALMVRSTAPYAGAGLDADLL